MRAGEAMLLFTSSPASGQIALEETCAIDPDTRLRRWLEPGVGLVDLTMSWDAFASYLREQPPVFCRHVCPVQVHVPLKQAASDLETLVEATHQLVPRLDATQPFSVQTRLIGEGWPYARYDVNTRLADALAAQGFTLDVRQPAQVLSVALTPEEGYLGVSYAADNLSDWAGGERRFRSEPEQISRAEFKLLEAMETFGLSWPAAGSALDLGAAPGGWTRIARLNGIQVTAIDPADLAPLLTADPGVRHLRHTAQRYLPGTDDTFDVILNDMRMDAHDSARLMLTARRNLKPGGWALMTLKLPHSHAERVATSALALLRERYTLIGARQLFHNRNEITVAVR
jgi:23S rRNA (cytidine2498-2'-O)-methyltransferase